jgi:hypothetical protein
LEATIRKEMKDYGIDLGKWRKRTPLDKVKMRDAQTEIMVKSLRKKQVKIDSIITNNIIILQRNESEQ